MDEFDLIRRYFRPLGRESEAGPVALGIGDDAALLRPSPGQQTVVCTDTMVLGRHFLATDDPAGVGWKSLAVNLSDLAAMGAEPRAALLALTLPEADADWLSAFAGGLAAMAARHGVALIGGDTTRGPLTITVTAIGEVPAGQAIRRAGARVGDLVCVTGSLGDAAAALAGHTDPRLAERLHRPEPRVAAGLALREVAHAGIDVSDGLLADLGHILLASGESDPPLGAELRADRLPASEALMAAVPDAAERLAFQLGGDDYELCVCLPSGRFDEAVAACAPIRLTVVGEVVAAPGVRLRDSSRMEVPPTAFGYRHFTGN